MAKDVRLPLKYRNLVNAITADPMCSKQHPRRLPKMSGPHKSSRLVRDWQVDYTGPFPSSKVLNVPWFVWTPHLA